MAAPQAQGETVAALLVRRVVEVGATHFHGVPGDYSFGVCDAIEADDRAVWVGCASELVAGYAADGYARVKGVGALVTTFGVGELSAMNAVAGAFSERVPVVVITSSPSREVLESGKHLIVHHSLLPPHGGGAGVFARMHDNITGAQALLTPQNARAEIERVLGVCLRYSQPVYINVPQDVAEQQACGTPLPPVSRPPSDTDALQQAVRLIADWVNGAQRPVVLADIGVQRGRLHKELLELLEATGLPCATLSMGRTALDEYHPAHMGVYQGQRSYPPAVCEAVEQADCLICIGANLTDYTTGGFTANLEERNMVDIKLNYAKVRKARFDDVRSDDILRALRTALRRRGGAEAAYWPRRSAEDGALVAPPAERGASLRSDAIMAALQQLLRPGDILVLETFTLTFAALPMRLPSGIDFFSQQLWGSIGFATPAAGGAARAAAALAASAPPGAPRRRVVLVTGDGSLQMSATALADMLRDGVAPLCLIVNNDGYLIERLLCKHADAAYNDIPRWRYAELPRVFGGAPERYHAARVETADALAPALQAAVAAQAAGRLAWIELVTPKLDVPTGARWMTPDSFNRQPGVEAGQG